MSVHSRLLRWKSLALPVSMRLPARQVQVFEQALEWEAVLEVGREREVQPEVERAMAPRRVLEGVQELAQELAQTSILSVSSRSVLVLLALE